MVGLFRHSDECLPETIASFFLENGFVATRMNTCYIDKACPWFVERRFKFIEQATGIPPPTLKEITAISKSNNGIIVEGSEMDAFRRRYGDLVDIIAPETYDDTM